MKRITIIAGYYGSGKTNIAINYALKLRSEGLPTSLVDLDIVNPYFRAADSKQILSDNDIELICSDYVNTNVDFPAIPSAVYSAIDNQDKYVVIDIGGDDRGAYALGRYKDKIVEEGNYQMLWVVNKYRPLTSNEADTIELQNEIEDASGLKFSGIINNSNLGSQTTIDDIMKSQDYANNLSKQTGLPLVYTTIADFENFKKNEIHSTNLENIFKIQLQSYNL